MRHMRIEVEVEDKDKTKVKRAVLNEIVQTIHNSYQQKTSFCCPGPATAVAIAFQ